MKTKSRTTKSFSRVRQITDMLSVWWAVRCGVSLAVEMRALYHQLAVHKPDITYESATCIVLEDTTPTEMANPRFRSLSFEAPEQPMSQIPFMEDPGYYHWAALEEQNRGRAAELRRELSRQDVENRRLEAEVADARERLEEAREMHTNALVSGDIEPLSTQQRNKYERGYPQGRSIWPAVFLFMGIAVLFSGEVFAISFPFWNEFGVDPTMLGTQIIINPTGVILGLMPGAIVTLFFSVLAEHYLTSLGILYQNAPTLPKYKIICHVSALVVYSILMITFAALFALSRHTTGEAAGAINGNYHGGAGGISLSVWAMVTVFLPFGVAFLLRLFFGELKLQKNIKEARRQWEMDKHAKRVSRERVEELETIYEQHRHALERQNENIQNKLRQIATEAEEAEVKLRQKVEADRLVHAHYESWRCARLSSYRQRFIREAKRRKKPHLIDPPPIIIIDNAAGDGRLHEPRAEQNHFQSFAPTKNPMQ